MGITKADMARKRPITDEHFVPADDAQAARLVQAEQQLGLSRFSGDEEAIEKAEARLEDVRAEVRAEGLSFVIASVGRKRFDELLREHPPTDATKEKDKDANFEAATFWPAAFAEAIEGDMTPEDWRSEFFDSPNWGAAEISELRTKVMNVHTTTRVAELGN